MLIKSENKIEQVLLEKGIIKEEQIKFCKLHQSFLQKLGIIVSLENLLILNGFAQQEDIDEVFHESSGVKICSNLPDNICIEHKIVIHGVENNDTVIISSLSHLTDEDKKRIINSLNSLGYQIKKIKNISYSREKILKQIYDKKTFIFETAKIVENFNFNYEDGHYIKHVINSIITEAIMNRASDIHLDKFPNNKFLNWISYRIDGILRYKYLLTPEAMAALVARIKTEASMDVTEIRLPQDGKITFEYKNKIVDIRVATIPMVESGETVTLRLLDPDILKPLKTLLSDYPKVYDSLSSIINIKQKTGGIILLTGPTGSGKSTTLYGILKQMNRLNLNIMTVEDPVEFTLGYVRQTPINPDAGITFANILRAHLRNDPDVLVIGEMRDPETVEIALRSAESGHLVLTTLHSIDCSQSINRLLSMIPDYYKQSGKYIIANYLKAIINQRLAIKLCPFCSISLKVKEIKKHLDVSLTEGVTTAGIFSGLLSNYDILDIYSIFYSIVVTLGLDDNETIKLPVLKECTKCGGEGFYGRTLAIEALFFPQDRSIRMLIENILIREDKNEISKIPDIEGMKYFSYIDSVSVLLRKGVIDFTTAFEITGMDLILVKTILRNLLRYDKSRIKEVLPKILKERKLTSEILGENLQNGS